MRLWLFGIALLCGTSLPAWAADEFGARFGEEAPVALEDSSILELQDIAPAAGDEAADTAEPAQIDPSTGALEESPAKDLLKIENENAQAPVEKAEQAAEAAPTSEEMTAEESALAEPQSEQTAAQEEAPEQGEEASQTEPAAGDQAAEVAPEQDQPAAAEQSAPADEPALQDQEETPAEN